MRPGYYTDDNNKSVEGHWHNTSIKPGDLYQSRKADEWFMVESVIKDRDPNGMTGWFCQIRPATQEEIDARLKPNPEAEKDMLMDFFGKFDN